MDPQTDPIMLAAFEIIVARGNVSHDRCARWLASRDDDTACEAYATYIAPAINELEDALINYGTSEA